MPGHHDQEDRKAPLERGLIDAARQGVANQAARDADGDEHADDVPIDVQGHAAGPGLITEHPDVLEKPRRGVDDDERTALREARQTRSKAASMPRPERVIPDIA